MLTHRCPSRDLRTEMLVGGPSFLPAKLKMTVTALVVSLPARAASLLNANARRALRHEVPRALQEEDLASETVYERLLGQAHSMDGPTLVDWRGIAVREEVDDRPALGREAHDEVLAAARLARQ